MARQFVLKREEAQAPVSYRIDYAGELNPQQYAAATASGGPILVVAGAGTGKTRTLVYRLAYLVESGVAPERIALLTFTRRASREMLARASGLLDGRCQQVRGGTFHSFCLGVLRRHATRIGFPNNFTILDSSDSSDVIDVIRGQMELGKKDRFPKKRTIQGMFSSVVNRDLPLGDLLEKEYPQFVPHAHDLEMLMRRFEGYKRSHGLMDYDDLLRRTLELFEKEPDVLKLVAGKCEHVLVDEYQDTNRLQARLVKAFSSMHGNVMAVGDDAQSIYRFRGADFRNILAFPEEFPGTRLQKLEHNYRSTQRILDLANHIIKQARHKFDKELFTERGDGDLPALVTAPDDRFESRFVCQMILDLREQGIPLRDVAVLFRSGFNSYDLEVELNRRNIPFVKYGGLKLSEAAHVKDVVAHLRILENPQDAISWNRVLQLLEGIGPKTAGQIIQWILEAGDDPLKLPDRPWSPKYADSLAALFALLRSLTSGKQTLGRQVDAVLDYYAPILKRVYYEDYPKREQDLDHLVSVVESYTDRATLLSSLALDPIELSALDVEPLEEDEAPLVLSTIHSAKGLEFKAVFVIHALEGVLPSSYSVSSDEEIDEELRLFYVAVTRAADHLFVTYPSVQYRRYHGQFLTSPSRFVQGVPEALLEPWSLVEEAPTPLLPEAGS
ncbi:MAG: UvrD-helicase domain-containing protein [Rhodothermales bacterium]|nr:UvrD-helicase domain-containing protein [Rhodothermales bacterium]